VVNWKVVSTKLAQGDAKKLKAASLKEKALGILEIIEKNPFQNRPPYEKLIADLGRSFLRRINIRHRFVIFIITYYFN
jgi:Txe/YoeB family toxin of toxin-antitoxin system